MIEPTNEELVCFLEDASDEDRTRYLALYSRWFKARCELNEASVPLKEMTEQFRMRRDMMSLIKRTRDGT